MSDTFPRAIHNNLMQHAPTALDATLYVAHPRFDIVIFSYRRSRNVVDVAVTGLKAFPTEPQ